MFIVARKNILLDGSHPCLLYGYGGFNISMTPYFSVSRVVLTRHLGAIFCIANIRGGGEYGEEWHKAGSLAKKQNCFDDFISAAEFLVSSGYTQSKKLCIEGGSNGNRSSSSACGSADVLEALGVVIDLDPEGTFVIKKYTF
ncbi:Prolyl endopeptidase [Camellia lanceoleosa]|uniref:Prolyl endopeptidase n=1 Tax=Camellia lanceoleosa TaxID=1840588 RepID=A0ACC0ICZ1_9ERIC|nr:Prolyl endopeptidase [Camellia lanceoleosa]